ncbi:alpha/beta hydrolase-fold protein [uncultured Lactobacillus sp.]|uniref:alpha/beta hydrolase n=1 Tax=uncultured Lactobacillus sp. TaxID=153152 RepID=UPI002803C9BB|nr:alpha/beta hydrolase-fold protein [uncultured Lactobacillus sp.]
MEEISYQTSYRGKNYKKTAKVYLPEGYTDSKKYNVVYLVHGSSEVKDGMSILMEEGNFPKLIDRLNKSGILTDTIFVFPTYYPSSDFVSPSFYDDDPLTENFAKNELIKDLIPAVESHYSTYANNTTDEGIKNSRDHRAIGGFSMGGITTWYAFQNDLPYMRYFLPIAGQSWITGRGAGTSTSAENARILAKTVEENPNLGFKILAGCGSGDGTTYLIESQIDSLRRLPQFDKQNTQYYTVSGRHDAPTVARVFEHYADQLFK